MHPALAPMIERNAFIGGCDGVAVTKSAELIDADPMGTIPHSLVLMFGDTVEALRAFHEVVDPKVRRVALIDTLQDEKFEAIRVAEALGKDLYAVRLDTPSSRRGDFYRILEEVRWELDLRGFEHVKILASGGIDEYEILQLNPLVDGYGVGTSIANAPVLNFALDIMEIEGKPMAKRGKWSGAKEVWRMPGTRAEPWCCPRTSRRRCAGRAARRRRCSSRWSRGAGSSATCRRRARSATTCSISWPGSTSARPGSAGCAETSEGPAGPRHGRPRRDRRPQARGGRGPPRGASAVRAGGGVPRASPPRATSPRPSRRGRAGACGSSPR